MEAVSGLGLKRRFEEVDSGSPYSTPKDSDDEISSSDSADSCDSLNPPSSSTLTPTSILRRQKPPGRKSVRFDAVTVYYFSRRQGFTSVPSQGGSSLGMARHHSAIRRYTLGEFAREQESSHRQALRQHLRQEKLNARKLKLTRNGTVECAEAESLTLEDVSDEDIDVDSVEVDDYFFLQPLPTKRRRALLRASGIARIDAEEKTELRAIRLSREECGCDCRFYCDPQNCGCSQAGIKCQVDRMSFPCGCSRDGCGNVAGRIEFNPLRVRTHYLHTIMKLDLEKKRQMGGCEGPELAVPLHPASPEPTQAALPAPLDPDATAQTQPGLEQSEAEYQAQRDSLDRENEAAVLHLQSAEEQERRREQEEGQGVDSGATLGMCLLPEPLMPSQEGMDGAPEEAEPVIVQGDFPPGASVLCFTENQVGPHHQAFLKDSSLVYYQIDPMETASMGLHGALGEEMTNGYKDCGVMEGDGNGGVSGGDAKLVEPCPRGLDETGETLVLPVSENCLEGDSGHLEGPSQSPEGLPPEGAHFAFEGESAPPPSDA
ncbi:cysteine/serine-rich nuclear protein 2 [Amia ocellicauda]|uniref:cysteine/serine-rich nuclear protein 2 n=1 Tax=Amia ocellicauda TaxID=2972642 RepID=UPI0034645645|nr:CSRN2 protein [Amia calva]